MNAAEVLERAADLIDERGHCKGMPVDATGAVCVQGALCVAIGRKPQFPIPNSANVAANALRQALGRNMLWLWNDGPLRTKDEITSTMRAVAATLRAQSGGTHEATVKQESNAAEPVSV